MRKIIAIAFAAAALAGCSSDPFPATDTNVAQAAAVEEKKWPVAGGPLPDNLTPPANDDEFYESIQAYGYDHIADKEDFVSTAKQVCVELDGGDVTPHEILTYMILGGNDEWTGERAAHFVAFTIGTYCPHHLGSLK